MSGRRTVTTILLALALGAGASGCSPQGDGDAAPAPTGSSAAPPAPTPTPTAPSATATPRPSPTSTPAEVLLTDQGIGDVLLAAEDPAAYDALVAALGAPTRPLEPFCLGSAQWAGWGGLTAFLSADGTLMGWALQPGPLPDVVRPPHDIYPGEPIRRVTDLGATPQPVLEPEDTGEYATSIGGVSWLSQGADPETPITWIAMSAAGCN